MALGGHSLYMLGQTFPHSCAYILSCGRVFGPSSNSPPSPLERVVVCLGPTPSGLCGTSGQFSQHTKRPGA
jgi:hypothetical protein